MRLIEKNKILNKILYKKTSILLAIFLILVALMFVFVDKTGSEVESTEMDANLEIHDNWVLLDDKEIIENREMHEFDVLQVYKGKSRDEYYNIANQKGAYLTWCLEPKISQDGSFGIFYTNRDYFIEKYIDKNDNLDSNRYSIFVKNIRTGEEKTLVNGLLETAYLTNSWWISDDRFICMKAKSCNDIEPVYVVCDVEGETSILYIPHEFNQVLSYVDNYFLMLNSSLDKLRLYCVDEKNNLVLIKKMVSFDPIESGDISEKAEKVLLEVSDEDGLKLKLIDVETGQEKLLNNPIKRNSRVKNKIYFEKFFFKEDDIIYSCVFESNYKEKYYFKYSD